MAFDGKFVFEGKEYDLLDSEVKFKERWMGKAVHLLM